MVTSLDRGELVKLVSCACLNLRRATRAITQVYDEAFQPLGLRATQFGLLAAIGSLGPVTITELADRFVMDRTTLTRNLRPLEREGFLAIAAGEDRRTRVVTLTSRGHQAVATAIPLWEQVQAKIVSGLGEQRFQSLLSDLGEVISVAKQQ